MDYNKYQVVGRLTANPEELKTAEGVGVKFTVVSSYKYKKDGQDVETSTFMNSVAWGKLAEIILKFCKKGSRVFTDGRLQQKTFQKEDGTKRVTYEYIVKDLISFDKKVEIENSPEDNSNFEEFEIVGKKISYEPEISIESVPF